MADRSVDYLLIGGGLAAANCARWLREEGGSDGGSILLVGREPDPPYNRPPLSKGFMQGKETREDALFRPGEWWKEQNIDLLTRTSVLKLDTDARVATLSNKEQVSFDKALLATGANVRRLNVDGCDLDGIHYLRTLGNSAAIREAAAQAERVVLIGGSYIGTEVAASLTLLGKKCSILMQEDVTLERFYGAEVGRFFQGVLEEHGIEIHGGDQLGRFEGSDGRVTKVITGSGKELDADMVVIGAGVAPDVSLAKAAGLEIGEGGGVKCSSTLESESAPGIWAAGDICEYDSPVHGSHMRIEHWDVAFNQGKTAALNMLGRPTPHDIVPYFFSDLADWVGYEYVGPGSGETAIRGSLDDGDFTVFYLGDDGAVKAALTVGRSDDLDHARRFIKEGSAPDAAQLADEGTDLADL
jgi:3-phenylpropionate/trans-cinnamate dioxygenase ferredoxin reductase component